MPRWFWVVISPGPVEVVIVAVPVETPPRSPGEVTNSPSKTRNTSPHTKELPSKGGRLAP